MRKIVGMVAAVIAVMALFGATVFALPEIADSAFQRVWERQDLLIEQKQEGTRSWTWGPTVSGAIEEELKQSPGGKRRVQYFEKSRMEINDPTADPMSKWYVTNGLLPIEMMTGKIQTGNDFQNEFIMHGQSHISVVGDPDNFPSYADLLPLYQSPGTVDTSKLNQPVTTMLNSDGSVTTYTDNANDAMTTLIQGNNGHGIVRAFDDFMKQDGFVYENRQIVRANVFDPIFVFGYPITEPYWVMAKVGGVEMPILFQVFERRVLTYNPANDLAFRVEMGNVGMHYYQWRYGDKPPVEAPTTEPTVEPTTEPTVEPTTEPTVEPTVEPTTGPYPEPYPEP